MKKLLSIIGAISLVGTSTTSLVACNTSLEYTPEELTKLKEENKINTKDQTIKDNLEWIAPQEKPFNNVDNKYYYVVWRGDKKYSWRIVKFKHDNRQIWNNKNISDYNNSEKLILHYYGLSNLTDLVASKKAWTLDNDNTYFKSVYRWILVDKPEPDLILDENGGNIKVNGE